MGKKKGRVSGSKPPPTKLQPRRSIFPSDGDSAAIKSLSMENVEACLLEAFPPSVEASLAPASVIKSTSSTVAPVPEKAEGRWQGLVDSVTELTQHVSSMGSGVASLTPTGMSYSAVATVQNPPSCSSLNVDAINTVGSELENELGKGSSLDAVGYIEKQLMPCLDGKDKQIIGSEIQGQSHETMREAILLNTEIEIRNCNKNYNRVSNRIDSGAEVAIEATDLQVKGLVKLAENGFGQGNGLVPCLVGVDVGTNTESGKAYVGATNATTENTMRVQQVSTAPMLPGRSWANVVSNVGVVQESEMVGMGVHPGASEAMNSNGALNKYDLDLIEPIVKENGEVTTRLSKEDADLGRVIWKNTLVGLFYNKAPSFGVVHYYANLLWSKFGLIKMTLNDMNISSNNVADMTKGSKVVGTGSNAYKDPLIVPKGPITRARAKKFKEELSGLIVSMWAECYLSKPNIDPNENKALVNLIGIDQGTF